MSAAIARRGSVDRAQDCGRGNPLGPQRRSPANGGLRLRRARGRAQPRNPLKTSDSDGVNCHQADWRDPTHPYLTAARTGIYLRQPLVNFARYPDFVT